MVNMALFTSVTGCRMASPECSVIAQIRAAGADTNRLFVRVWNRAALPGNACHTVVTTPSIQLARRAVLLMHSPPHHYKALQRAHRPLRRQCRGGPVCFQWWSPVASQLSCCADASALADPLSESTLLAAGPCGWLRAKAAASVAFWDVSAACPARAGSFCAAVTLSI